MSQRPGERQEEGTAAGFNKLGRVAGHMAVTMCQTAQKRRDGVREGRTWRLRRGSVTRNNAIVARRRELRSTKVRDDGRHTGGDAWK